MGKEYSMNRQEFIRELRKSMTGQFETAQIQETVDYYEDYIDLQIKKGKSEEEVLRELGDPRLLTKSMRAAGKGKTGGVYSSTHKNEYGADSVQPNHEYAFHGKTIRVPCLIWAIVLILISLLAVALIGAVVGVAFRVLLYLFPVLLVVGGIYWIYCDFIKK